MASAMASSLLLVLCVGLSVAPCVVASTQPRDTDGIVRLERPVGAESPPYKTIRKEDTYEVRQYEPVKYVATNVTRSLFTVALAQGYGTLYRYFSGANEDGISAPVTVPTVVEIFVVDDLQDTYTIALYLPETFQESTPKPTIDGVVITPAPKTTSYVRVFGGFATKNTILEEAEALRRDLEKDKVEFQKDHFFFLLYDPPTKLTDRHNEVVWDAPYDTSAVELSGLEEATS